MAFLVRVAMEGGIGFAYTLPQTRDDRSSCLQTAILQSPVKLLLLWYQAKQTIPRTMLKSYLEGQTPPNPWFSLAPR